MRVHSWQTLIDETYSCTQTKPFKESWDRFNYIDGIYHKKKYCNCNSRWSLVGHSWHHELRRTTQLNSLGRFLTEAVKKAVLSAAVASASASVSWIVLSYSLRAWVLRTRLSFTFATSTKRLTASEWLSTSLRDSTDFSKIFYYVCFLLFSISRASKSFKGSKIGKCNLHVFNSKVPIKNVKTFKTIPTKSNESNTLPRKTEGWSVLTSAAPFANGQ